MDATSPLAGWSAERIDAECANAYRAYYRSIRARHLAYFKEHEALCDPRRPFCAATLAGALPPGWGTRLERLIPPERLHRHHLSGGSSQMLALGLLGPAVLRGQGLEWLFEPYGPLPPIGAPLKWEFEYSAGFGLLNEVPRTTDIDFFISGPRGVIAVEAKFTERGLGACSCKGRADGRCDHRVRVDRPYWTVARSAFGLDGPRPPEPCELSVAYQAVRNVAAVQEMTGLREVGVFALLYDARNPYFSGAGGWPGWAPWLERVAREVPGVVVRAVPWQQLVPLLPTRGRREVAGWAAEKHGLP